MTTPPANERRHAVVVLGMHRSGTSAMTRVVALAGATLPTHMLTPGPHNPEGFWEPHEVMALNDRILGELDTSWNDPFGPREFRQRQIPWRRYLDEARDVIVRNYGDAQFIVVKEPRTTLLLDLWREALEGEGYRVSYVIMVRRPDEVAQSLKARDGTGLNKALITWTTYMLAAELGTRGKSRVFVSFDDLLQDPEEVLNRLENHLNVSLPRRTWESALQTQEFLKSDSKHYASSRWPSQLKQFTQIERFYAYLAASSRDEPWNADISDEVALWLSQLENVFGPILKQSERELRQLELAQKQLEDALTQTCETHEVALSDLRQEHALRERQLGESLAASQSDAEAARQRGSDLANALAALGQEYGARELELSRALSRATAEIAELRPALDALRAEGAARESDLDRALSETIAENAELRASLDSLLREQTDAMGLRRQLARVVKENEELKVAVDTQASEHEGRELQLTQGLDRAAAESAELRASLDSLLREQTDVPGLRRELARFVAENEELKVAVDTQLSKHEKRETELTDSFLQRESELKEKLIQASTVSRAAQAEVDSERRRTSELFDVIARREAREAEAQSPLARLWGWLRSLFERRIRRSLARGNQARDRGDWARAAVQYKAHLEAQPRDFSIWVQFGHVLKEGGRPVDALSAYQTAQGIIGDDADLLLQLGHVHKVLGRTEEAGAYYRRAVALGERRAIAELDALPSLSRAPLIARDEIVDVPPP